MFRSALRSMGKKFSFGVISDVQYANKPLIRPGRFERDAMVKLQAGLDHWKTFHEINPLQCIVNLGDIIDAHQEDGDGFIKDAESMSQIMNTFNSLNNINKYHVLGNHCVWNLGRSYAMKELGLKKGYYDIKMSDGWRFVILDGTDMSVMKDSMLVDEAMAYRQENSHRILDDWNGGFGRTQKEWLAKIISDAKVSGEKLILFCHWPILNLWDSKYDIDLLWNADDVIQMLDKDVVFMWMSGHMHENGYRFHNGIHHLTLSGVVSTPIGEQAHAIVHVNDEDVVIEGFGSVRALSNSLVLRG
eukprot:TRINITY_DN95_c0_g1_i1.p1 TRINITY_DN95_c0_g1~~TRINITY_DN95_c0_g1_i1.p1  ORF type:complete len:302 (-),score=38.43 TRINITY_DN95_c0_g1_i1:142-1047(-)